MAEPDDYQHQLRDAALTYAEHGWPIAPGVRPVPRRRDGWPVPDPAVLPYHGPMNPNAVGMYWRERPYAVLVGTGFHWLDVFRLRQPTATKILESISDAGKCGPVAVLPDEQWLFLVEAGDAPPAELLGRQVRYHGPGDWLPLPPTRIGRHAITWHVGPASVGWRLFPREELYKALRATRPRRRRRDHSAGMSVLEPTPARPPFTLVISPSAPHLTLERTEQEHVCVKDHQR